MVFVRRDPYSSFIGCVQMAHSKSSTNHIARSRRVYIPKDGKNLAMQQRQLARVNSRTLKYGNFDESLSSTRFIDFVIIEVRN